MVFFLEIGNIERNLSRYNGGEIRMTPQIGMNRPLAAAVAASICLLAVSQGRTEEAPVAEPQEQEEEKESDTTAETAAETTAASSPTVVTVTSSEVSPQPATPASSPSEPVVSPATAGPQHPYANLRRLPKKLRPVEGQAPPEGYVEIQGRKRGLIIAGSVLFGTTYLASVIASVADRMLLIPLAGPMIAGYGTEDPDDEVVYAARLFGTLGTIAQVTGVTLFILGMAQKRTVWLRQDIAGVKFQVTPVLVGRNEPGIGFFGTF